MSKPQKVKPNGFVYPRRMDGKRTDKPIVKLLGISPFGKVAPKWYRKLTIFEYWFTYKFLKRPLKFDRTRFNDYAIPYEGEPTAALNTLRREKELLKQYKGDEENVPLHLKGEALYGPWGA